MTASRFFYRNRFRYVILCLGFFCLTSIASNYLIINFTFICMSKDTTELVDNGNGTYVNALNYTPLEKSAIIWAVAIGTIIGSLPVNICYIKLGAR
ncbi:unnamed protein product [Nippostrongylus brasiliensis]|uniref:MFS domain-containing protein n=1 Tax=Nippostrongylus brasiliensis TaxID=27835 RepID=A0A0N4XL08_NIPBR|nr:unnamed protein product [Nippostrongylus brasiliensis]